MRSGALFFQDLRFQLRHGLYGAYLFVCAAYILILHTVPSSWASTLTYLFVFTDTGILGAIFAGGIVLLEREQGVHTWIAVSPARPVHYLAAKIASLTLLSLAASLLLIAASPAALGGAAAYGKAAVLGGAAAPIAAVLFGSAGFTCFGILIGIRSRTILGFFSLSVPIGIVAMLPLLLFISPGLLPLLPLLPTGGMFLLLRSGYLPLTPVLLSASLVTLLGWSAAAVRLCIRSYRSYIAEGGGELS